MNIQRLLAGCGALSLSLSLLAGCAAPTTVPSAPPPVFTEDNSTVPQASPAPVAPAAAAPLTLPGKASFKGQPAVGYTVTVYDARTNQPVERKTDMAGATGLAVLDQHLVTDDQGAFKLQVVGLVAGQALRVVASKGKTSLEALVTGDMQTLAAKQRRVLVAEVNLTLTELTTALSKVARNVVRTTQVLTPQAAAPILAKLMADMAGLSADMEAQLQKVPAVADQLVQAESPDTIGQTEAAALNVLINNAGALQKTTQLVADLVAEAAKRGQEAGNRSAAAADPKVAEALAKIEYAGTVLVGALDPAKGTINLTNRVTGRAIDAAGGSGAIADRVTPNRHNNAPAGPVLDPNGAYVANEQDFIAALADPSKTTIYLTQDIDLSSVGAGADPSVDYLDIYRPVTIDGGANNYKLYNDGDSDNHFHFLNAAVTLKNMALNNDFWVMPGAGGVTFDHVTFTSGTVNATVFPGEPATFKDCTFRNYKMRGIQGHGNLTVDHCTFEVPDTDATGLDESEGISIEAEAGIPSITNCQFIHLQAGIRLMANDDNTLSDADLVGQISANTFKAPVLATRKSTAYGVENFDLSTDVASVIRGNQNAFEDYSAPANEAHRRTP